MGPDRVGGQLQPLGDVLPAGALRQASQNFTLTRREPGQELTVLTLLIPVVQQQPQHHPRFAGGSHASPLTTPLITRSRYSSELSFRTQPTAPASIAARIRSASEE